MSEVTARIEAYIERAADWAQPICRALRTAIVKAEPGIVEEWKWGCPVFSKGGLLCAIGAFQPHVRFIFFKGSLLKDPRRKLEPKSHPEMQSRVMLFKPGAKVDAKAVADFVRQAAALNAKGVKLPARLPEVKVPPELRTALSKNRKASAFFASLTPGGRREYVRWIETAKRPETRAERVRKTVLQCGESKSMHWKYQ